METLERVTNYKETVLYSFTVTVSSLTDRNIHPQDIRRLLHGDADQQAVNVVEVSII